MSTNFNLGNLAFAKLNMSAAAIASGTIAINNLDTASIPILSSLQNTQKITFINPGTVTVYVCQSVDINGNPLSAGPVGGSVPILPGGFLEVTGNGVAGAWNGAAFSGSNNPLTILVSQTP